MATLEQAIVARRELYALRDREDIAEIHIGISGQDDNYVLVSTVEYVGNAQPSMPTRVSDVPVRYELKRVK